VRRAVATLALCVVASCDSRGAAAPATAAAARPAGPPAQPVRGAIHTVNMQMDNEGYRFEPNYITVEAGDGVRFQMVSGVPHNVAFDERFIPRNAREQLVANIAALGGRDLAAPVVTTVDSSFTISTAGLPSGDYLFYCAPHRSLNMHGVLTIR
jgi:plastocyanin